MEQLLRFLGPEGGSVKSLGSDNCWRREKKEMGKGRANGRGAKLPDLFIVPTSKLHVQKHFDSNKS